MECRRNRSWHYLGDAARKIWNFLGDTFGYDFKPNPANPGPNGGSWRSNVLAFSEDNDLEDGLSFSNMATDDKGMPAR